MDAKRIVAISAVFILLALVIGSARSNDSLIINAPSDWIREGNIEVYSDRIVIRIENASISRYEDTKSMVPILDKGANGIRIVPNSPDEIHIGDIVTYEADWIDGLVVHRVVYIGEDYVGKYFILKGDNNIESDPEKVRFEQIMYVTVALIY
jgi:signal peptidase I